MLSKRKCLFVATVATDAAVFVATLPVECQSLTETIFLLLDNISSVAWKSEGCLNGGAKRKISNFSDFGPH